MSAGSIPIGQIVMSAGVVSGRLLTWEKTENSLGSLVLPTLGSWSRGSDLRSIDEVESGREAVDSDTCKNDSPFWFVLDSR